MSSPSLAGARCATHPDVPAVAICLRCGAFGCEGCIVYPAGATLCRTCHARLGEQPSRRATVALVLATAGFIGFAPGVVALVLAQRELNDIRAGRSPAGGESTAELARNLGWFHLAMLAISVAGVAYRLFGER